MLEQGRPPHGPSPLSAGHIWHLTLSHTTAQQCAQREAALARCGNPVLGEIVGHTTATGGGRRGNRPVGGGLPRQAGTHVGVAFHTQDLLQEHREAGEEANAAPEAHGQDDVGLVPQELEEKGRSAQRPHPAGPLGRAPPTPTHQLPPRPRPSLAPDPTKPTSFSPSRNFSEVDWAAPAEGGVGGTLSQRHAVASRQARPAGIT